ncbi:MAG: aminopeptidase [Candidatus Marinimicrobia bacterium]|nr:aminopeptidase [Candidatus Neomarinimicrobiota bacterium]|tara:strand:+ start:3975 stop:6338 length:2364 start_codon:yes stop_codon:yes gene_type:complete
MFKKIITTILAVSFIYPQVNLDKFKQLNEDITTPNTYRTAAGYPGHDYWQQEADYDMNLVIDDENQILYGEETITFHNNSPDQLGYLWVQLDQNVRALDSDSYKIQSSGDFGAQRGREKMMVGESIPLNTLQNFYRDFDGGFKIEHVKDALNRDLPYIINKTMMRIDLPRPLRAGEVYKFKIKWWYNINDHIRDGGRSGYEYFEDDDNYIYTIAQFFPRMCMYNDIYGWQNKQFLGRGEFTLIFGDYDVKITVPADHILGATGVLQNSQQVLTKDQITRLEESKTADDPVKIVTNSEALENEKTHSEETKTWHFKAENVRDYAFATSRKYIWDAIGVDVGENTVMAMSYYPNEAEPLWGQYSTKSVAHTVEVYSKYTFDYPYPVAISAHIDRMGMEYPMICFNGYRPEEDGTYSERTKKGLIGVIIHEVGHFWFPMIVNSDERQWTWMDEGLNSFMDDIAGREWDTELFHPSSNTEYIINYMKGDKSNIMPIMTNSESIYQFGANAYGKPTLALNILRDTIMGRELFDYAFKEYSKTWMFKHPTPTDFFRIMENASAVDLDWFWRGWFFSNDHVDLSIESVDWYQLEMDPEAQKSYKKKADNKSQYYSAMLDEKDIESTVTDRDPATRDFYDDYDKNQVTKKDKRQHRDFMDDLSDKESELINQNDHFYSVRFSDNGGIIMPIILEFEYEDGEKEVIEIPVEIWRFNRGEVTKVFKTEKPIKNMTLDPFFQIADVERNNNHWPEKRLPTRFETYKSEGWGGSSNLMQRVRDDVATPDPATPDVDSTE